MLLIDPVCGLHLDTENEMYAYQDHTYYFCSDGCKQEFVSDPEKYAAIARERNPEGYGERLKAA